MSEMVRKRKDNEMSEEGQPGQRTTPMALEKKGQEFFEKLVKLKKKQHKSFFS